jgi:large-conductance mechanosensitive channel
MLGQTSFVSDFKTFIIENNIITTMSAVTIAFSTGTMIRSFVCDILLPAIYALFLKRIRVLNGAFAPINRMNLDSFVKEFVTFIFVVLTIFLFVYYFFKVWVQHAPKAPPQQTAEEIQL